MPTSQHAIDFVTAELDPVQFGYYPEPDVQEPMLFGAGYSPRRPWCYGPDPVYWSMDVPRGVRLAHGRTDQISQVLCLMAQRLTSHRASRDAEIRHYGVPLSEVFKAAASEYPAVSIDVSVMAGAPCVIGTRIPVYMILDAIEAGGSIHAALESYPRLTEQQIRDALGFAKVVVECPIEQETPSTLR